MEIKRILKTIGKICGVLIIILVLFLSVAYIYIEYLQPPDARLYQDAQIFEDKGKQDIALLKYQKIVDNYPNSKYIEQAKKAIDRLGPAKLYSEACILESEGESDLALKKYQKIVKEYPDSEYADKAKIAIDRIRPAIDTTVLCDDWSLKVTDCTIGVEYTIWTYEYKTSYYGSYPINRMVQVKKTLKPKDINNVFVIVNFTMVSEHNASLDSDGFFVLFDGWKTKQRFLETTRYEWESTLRVRCDGTAVFEIPIDARDIRFKYRDSTPIWLEKRWVV